MQFPYRTGVGMQFVALNGPAQVSRNRGRLCFSINEYLEVNNMQLSATTLTGTNVENAEGQSLGKIEDLMIDVDTGEVDYAVVSFGGFLGLGDKLFAVPLEAMKADTVHEKFVLNESKERLENAPGFDKDNWPRSADPQWRRDVRSYYGL